MRESVLGSGHARHALVRTVSSFEVDMARIPETGDSSVVSMAEYDKRAKRISGNTSEIAEDLKKSRQATSLRLIETAERKASTPRLTLVGSGEEPAGTV